MKFKYRAIGKNTAENMEWLEKLGYKRGYHTYPSGNCIFTKDGFDYPYVTEAVLNDYPNAMDCRNNPALFQAVTAMREDSDYMQWFTCKVKDGLGNQLPDSWVLCTQKTLQDFGWVNNSPNTYGKNTPYHKATIDEIIKRFTKDENMQ